MADATPVAALRPGALLGPYPEREPLEAAAGNGPGQSPRQALWRRSDPDLRPQRLAAFVAHVDAQAADLQADDLAGVATDLRLRLAREGLTEELVARSFALVREAAHQVLGMRHYDSQLMAGRILLSGALAEMATGEGKTLAATLAAATAALAGFPVHVVTANDYLVSRDAAAMGPLFRALGLSTGAITESSTPEMRRAAYARSVTYNTSKQLAFDYLRDRMAMGQRRGALHLGVERLYSASPATARLMMRGLCLAIVDEADSVLIDDARTPFVIARELPDSDVEGPCRGALALAATLDLGADYTLDRRANHATLTDCGCGRLETAGESLPADARARRALVEQALAALHLYQRDRHYLVREGAVRIIDPNTGRLLADRSWDRGLHQMIELKESCAVTVPRETLARLTFQRLFQRYLRLGGMTGTAKEVASELRSTYGLGVVSLPTHKPVQRVSLPRRWYGDGEQKWRAIVERVRELRDSGRPVLVGTRSVPDSEHLGSLLDAAGIPHHVLNARQDGAEARIIAAAGKPGQVTVATNMAGRGTDIVLGEGVADRGGLHVIAAEANDSRRLDRQLAGRGARQGDPGSWEMFGSPDDELLTRSYPGWIIRFLRNLPGSDFMSSAAIHLAQTRCERHQRRERRDLAIIQDRIDRLLSFSGRPE